MTGYADYKEMLKDPAVEAVVVATPTQTHYDVLMDVIASGKPIFVEKPITFTVEEAEKIMGSRRKGGPLLTGRLHAAALTRAMSPPRR